MTGSFFHRAITKYGESGLTGVLYSGIAFVHGSFIDPIRRYLLDAFVCTRNDDIFAAAEEVVTTHGCEITTIRYSGSSPQHLPACLAAMEGEIESPPRVVCVYANAEVVGTAPVIRVRDTYIVPSTVGTVDEQKWHGEKIFQDNVGLVRAVWGKAVSEALVHEVELAFLLTGPRGTGFAHWFYETLPKLRALEGYQKRTKETVPPLVPQKLTSWQRDSLALMGYPPASCIPRKNRTLRARRLLVPSHRLRQGAGEFVPSPTDLRWVRSRILGNLSKRNHNFPGRIYISRSDATRRRVRNEKEVIAMLGLFGFSAFEPGHFSFADQVRLFSGADVIVGAHGAGLTNMLYAENATVVELVSTSGKNQHYFVMANELGLQYEFCLCEYAPDEHQRPRYRDIIVDLELLRGIIDHL